MAFFKDAQKILEVFRTGKGIPWGDHDSDLFQGTERALKPGYRTNLVSSWIPALDSGKVEEKLKKGGAIVADIGCGHGISTVMIVEPFANDKTEDNLNPLGRIFYAGSTMVCVPTSLAYNGPALGAQAGEKRMSEVVRAGGFKDFKRATQ